MRLRKLWEVHGPGGRFDEDGRFVPTETFGVLPSLFLNVVVLPIVVICFATLLSLELLTEKINRLLPRTPRRGIKQ